MSVSTPDDDRPLASYVSIITAYAGVLLTFASVLRRTGRRPPERISAHDLAVVALATNKASRLVSRDKITSPIRAPFTELEEQSPGDIVERPAGAGWRRSIGELLTCPFCISQWVATAFVFGLVVAPRATRVVGSIFAALTGADFLQLVYALAEKQLRS